ncbi:MAG: glycosyl hydrolase, partial [Acidobacteria bacterium]|nr:glycosyl hydrolase [Acidobacteriota bacterium]
MSRELLLDWGLTWLFLMQLALILWNQRALGRPLPHLWEDEGPLVSILVPARNEEATIAGCLCSLLAQDYPNLEILVLDDGSEDATPDIVRALGGSRVRLLAGAPLPSGWTGKNWACQQLSRAARGDLLCFVDSDTTLDPGTVSAAVGLQEEHRAGLVSFLPRAERRSVSG